MNNTIIADRRILGLKYILMVSMIPPKYSTVLLVVLVLCVCQGCQKATNPKDIRIYLCVYIFGVHFSLSSSFRLHVVSAESF